MFLVRKSNNGIRDAMNNINELYQISKEEFTQTKNTILGVSKTITSFKLFSINECISIAFFNSNELYFCGAVTELEYQNLSELSRKSDNNINLEA